MNAIDDRCRAEPELCAGNVERYLVLAVATVFLLLALAYFTLQMRLPAVGALVVPNVATDWQPDGVPVQVVGRDDAKPAANGASAQDGDLVVGIAGRSLSGWAPLIARGRSAPQWQMDQVASLTVRRDGRETEVQAPLRPFPLLAAISGTWSVLLFAAVTFVVGAFVFWRRPGLLASHILFLWGAALLSAMTWALGLDILHLTYSVVFWLYTATTCAAYLLFWTSGLHLSLVFPSPHPWLKGREQLLWLLHPLALLITTGIAFVRIANGGPLAWLSAFLRSVDVVGLPTGVLMILIFAWGYRTHYDEEARQRARIFLFTAIICGGLGILVWNLAPLILGRPLISTNVAGLLLIPAPLALAVSVVRHRLFDIDVIIRRTLIYTLLTTALALVYFASVVVLQATLGALSGGLSSLAVVLSTLAIATLFSPLRGWIQTAIDRRFYRSKYDARATATKFAEAARSEVDLDALSAELVHLIRRTVQPSHISLWLADKSSREDRS
jgi:hypothetical protein